MATNNSWNSENPAQVARGGTGLSTITDGGIMLGSGTSAVTTLGPLSKGALVAGDGTTDPQSLSVGSDDQVLTADSAEATGLKWATPSTTGVTSLTTCNIYDDFIYGRAPVSAVDSSSSTSGEEVWKVNGSGTSRPSISGSTSGHPGVWLLGSGSSYVGINMGSSFVLGGGQLTWEAIIKVGATGSSKNAYMGLCRSGRYSALDDNLIFKYEGSTSSNWYMHSSSSSSSTETDTGTAVDTDWHTMKFVVNAAASSVEFFIDGSSEGTITTNINTSDALQPYFVGSSSSLYIDAMRIVYEVSR